MGDPAFNMAGSSDAEMVRRAKESARLEERAKWEKRLGLCIQDLIAHGHQQAAINLQEVVDELSGKGA